MKTHWEHLAELVPSLARADVLDIGSGKGGFLIEATQKSKSAAGLETNPEYIRITEERAREAGAVVNVVHGVGERLPFPDSSFDFINMCELIEHVKDPEQVIREAVRVLRPRGCLYISAPNRYGLFDPHFHLYFVNWLPRTLSDTYIRMFGREKDYRDVTAGYQRLSDMHYYTFREIQRLVERAGCSVVDSRTLRIKKRYPGLLGWPVRALYRVMRPWYIGTFHILARKG